VAVDPEMLRKVFENLIDENLRRGLAVFYTRAQARRQPPVSGAPVRFRADFLVGEG
jgi:hypothetical protein